MFAMLILTALVSLLLIGFGIYQIVFKKNKKLGITLLILAVAIFLYGLSVCGIIF
ncbi:MAG: hypothetical protein LBE36_05945 [Flavobacteriaceae bacterium]|jgi:hypothetical protein|nr:hypothetical protein [Flavobacteriaceae bacterium]